MDVVRLGKKGQVSLPKAMLKRLGMTGEALLLGLSNREIHKGPRPGISSMIKEHLNVNPHWNQSSSWVLAWR